MLLYRERKSWLLLTILAMLAMSSALDLDDIGEFIHVGKRQTLVGTGGSATQAQPTSTAGSSVVFSSAAQTSQASSIVSTPSAASTPSSDAASSTPASSTPAPSSSVESSTPASSTPAPSSAKAKTSSEAVSWVTSALVSTSIQQFVTVVTTVSGSETIALTQTSSRTILETTGLATITSSPSLNNGNNSNSGSSGLSTSSKKIIGGVVGGVGGAILLGGIALVCWRIWGRKKHNPDDDMDLMAGTGSAIGEKPAGANNTPFQTNLEQYHNPGGRPNAAANF